MKEIKTKTTFNDVMSIYTQEEEMRKSLEFRTENNPIFQDVVSDDYDYDIHKMYIDEIIMTIDLAFEKAYDDIEHNTFCTYKSDLISNLEKDYTNWELIQQIEDGILPFEKWPNYSKYLDNLTTEKSKFDKSSDATCLTQIQEEWRNFSEIPSPDFSTIDWTVHENRAQLLDWIHGDSEEKELPGLEISECYNYEDFCLQIGTEDCYDNSGFIIEDNCYGLLRNPEFLIKHYEALFDCVSVMYFILDEGISTVIDLVNKYPKEMLSFMSDFANCVFAEDCPEELLDAFEEFTIPKELESEYSDLKEYFAG